MVSLSENAKNRFDDYLKEVRDSLRDCTTVDADEIEQNIIDHIQNELSGVAEPVALDDLDPVLKKLGSPAQWVPDDEKTDSARLTQSRVLTYISFALTAAFVLMSMPRTLAVLLWRPILETLIVFPGNLLLPAFILARLALAGVWTTKDLGRQRWLAYPPLILAYISILWRILFLPALIISVFYLPRYWSYLKVIEAGGQIQGYDTFAVATITASVGVWWIALGTILLRQPKLLHVIFRPFANWFNRKWAAVLLCIGLAMAICSLALRFLLS
ncbi:MAG TPA: hypothetical protein VMX13_07665 [Sedimentisphaerales bacterium]|nr:hypothetical protein [Sedimentisphaerales bacterium]